MVVDKQEVDLRAMIPAQSFGMRAPIEQFHHNVAADLQPSACSVFERAESAFGVSLYQVLEGQKAVDRAH